MENGKQNHTDVTYMKPKFGIYSRHSLHGQFEGVHCLILFLKIGREAAFFMSFGTIVITTN